SFTSAGRLKVAEFSSGLATGVQPAAVCARFNPDGVRYSFLRVITPALAGFPEEPPRRGVPPPLRDLSHGSLNLPWDHGHCLPSGTVHKGQAGASVCSRA